MQHQDTDSPLNWSDRIDCNPDVLAGKPRIKGTRDGIEAAIACAAEAMHQARSLPPVVNRDDW